MDGKWWMAVHVYSFKAKNGENKQTWAANDHQPVFGSDEQDWMEITEKLDRHEAAMTTKQITKVLATGDFCWF